jgi:hypothetical protein
MLTNYSKTMHIYAKRVGGYEYQGRSDLIQMKWRISNRKFKYIEKWQEKIGNIK